MPAEPKMQPRHRPGNGVAAEIKGHVRDRVKTQGNGTSLSVAALA
jgi:hypothetical protein